MIKIYGVDVLNLGYVEPMYERDTSSMTEQAGYVDAETQVKRMLVAGANLMSFRKGEFDYDDGVVPDDVVPDPTLDPMFDLADVSAIKKRLAEKAEASKKEEAKSSEADDVADA